LFSKESIMELEPIAMHMAHNAQRISALVENVTPEQARWKPDPQSWSILEVINHLADEEHLDFRVRLEYILHRPDQSWPPIDPQGWVVSRRYNQRELKSSLDSFLNARRESLDWLRRLSAPDWTTACDAPFGRITAGDMLAAWAAHDLLHLRQLVELQWAHTLTLTKPYRVYYAGDW
jgi:hypothetical protein